VLYPRDPSLDPQLVWKGKDQLDQEPLEVPAVPIYIQEKIHPQALIDDLRARALVCRASRRAYRGSATTVRSRWRPHHGLPPSTNSAW
jgi:hypothetical protein